MNGVPPESVLNQILVIHHAIIMNFLKRGSRPTLALSLAVLVAVGGCSTRPANAAAKSSAAKKRILVVTTTTGFRHSSIETGERILATLAEQNGFILDYARGGKLPGGPKKPAALKDGADDSQKEQYAADMKKFESDQAKYKDLEKGEQEKIRSVLAEKMSAAALKNYDAVIFENTTGDLPLPDKEAFLSWIKSGKAFIGTHSATDTFRGHTPLDPYVEMIGGEFRTHGAQADVECLNQDPNHPACKNLGATWALKDEIYLLNGFDRAKVHGLLNLDKEPNSKAPGDYPIAWCKKYGQGNVFYTSLGHREDVWESEKYQKHLLGGIRWALGLEKGDSTPQITK